MINLVEIAKKVYNNMCITEVITHDEGIKFALDNLEKEYRGSYLDCIQYLTAKITIASINAVNNPMYIGCIILYSDMIDELAVCAKKEG